jgi:Na+/H+ antiporter NhaA
VHDRGNPPSRGFRQWWNADTASGLVLLIGTVLALVWVNSPLAPAYHDMWETSVGSASLGLRLDVRDWVNNGLMVLFFFVIGLELKQELACQHCRCRAALLTPAGIVGGCDVLSRLLRLLSPVSAFLVVPVFAIANIGVEIAARVAGSAFGSAVTRAVVA